MSTKALPEIVLRAGKTGLEKFMGQLEAKVMEAVWGAKNMTVKRVHFLLSRKRTYAYTTIMTVMNRLVNKNFLIRTKVSHSYQYAPTLSKQKFIDYAMQTIVEGLKSDYPSEFAKSVGIKTKKKKK